MKNWHRTCFLPLVSFFCSTPQSHSSVPTAFHPGHCVSGSQGWPPPSAATASAARSVLDGREHGGTLLRIGDDLPNSASRVFSTAAGTGTGKRMAHQSERPSNAVIATPSNSVIRLKGGYDRIRIIDIAPELLTKTGHLVVKLGNLPLRHLKLSIPVEHCSRPSPLQDLYFNSIAACQTRGRRLLWIIREHLLRRLHGAT
jgi:hypothetical protein